MPVVPFPEFLMSLKERRNPLSSLPRLQQFLPAYFPMPLRYALRRVKPMILLRSSLY
jgi:hypothetical protein